MAYHQFTPTDESESFGSFEVFYESRGFKQVLADRQIEPGFYWWACLPGCLPDSDPVGPFQTEAEAIADANS